jgi:hypothetical protein
VSPYLFAPALAVGAIAWLTMGAVAAELACGVAARGRGRALLAGLAVVLVVITVTVGFRAFSTLGDAFGSSFAQRLDPGVQRVCRLGRPVHLVSTTGQWYQVLEVGAALGECAPDVKMDPGVGYIVGARRTSAHQPADVVTVRLESPAVPLASGWTRVAHDDDASLDVKASPGA